MACEVARASLQQAAAGVLLSTLSLFAKVLKRSRDFVQLG